MESKTEGFSDAGACKGYSAEEIVAAVSQKNDDLIKGFDSLPAMKYANDEEKQSIECAYRRWENENQLCQTEMLSSVYILMVLMNERIAQIEAKRTAEDKAGPRLVNR